MPDPRARPELRINAQRSATGGGGTPAGDTATPAAPILNAPYPPQNVRVLTGPYLIYSAVTPQAGLTIGWTAPIGLAPDSYIVQWATDGAFTSPTSRTTGLAQISAALDGMPVGTTIYMRVASRRAGVQGDWGTVVSATTPADTTAPDAPSTLAFSWSGLTGDLTITWVNPGSVNLRDCRVRIYASNGGTLLREVYSANGLYVWTRGQNYSDGSGTPDAAVYVVVTARSWGGVFSATDATGTATLSAPASPSGLTHSWASGADTAGADLLITWTASAAVASYTLSIDGTARTVVGGRYVYTLDQNAAEHSGTADPALSLSLVAVDALGQSSTAATATATNAAPPATTITAAGFVSVVTLTIAATGALDLRRYRVRVYLDASLVETIYLSSTSHTYQAANGTGAYTFDVAVEDLFGQTGTASAQTTAANVTDLTTFVADLREDVTYTDSIATAPATLAAALKDDNTSSGGITYASSASAWRWTLADRKFKDRHRNTTVSLSASTPCYLGVSLDGSTYTYYYGGSVSGGVWAPTSSTATEATAQSGAVALNGAVLVKLASTTEARYIRLGHRNTGGSYILREFYPRSLVSGDDIQAQSITGATIAAATLTADLMSVASLSAIAADMGTITAGSISSATITGSTITGGTVQTAASGARAQLDSTGLKTYSAAGVVQVEATTSTDGALRAGAGKVSLSSAGLRLDTSLISSENDIAWLSGSTTIGRVGWGVGTYPATKFQVEAPSGSLELGTSAGSVSGGVYSGTGVMIYSGAVYIAPLLYAPSIAVDPWTNATLQNSWASFSGSEAPASYYRDPMGVVRLRGMISGGTTTSGTVLFTLPSGYRPEFSVRLPVLSNNALGYALVATNGQVQFVSGSNTWFCLDSITFRVAY